MMHILLKRWIITGAVIAVLILIWLLIFPYLTSDELQTYVEQAHPYGPFVIILYTIIAHVVAPLAGIPAFLIGVPIFGIYETILYIYIGSMISATINFYISRKLGRQWIMKLTGTSTMHKIDEFIQVSGTSILIAARVLGLAVFEEISYAAGLTRMHFKKYMLITLLASIIPHAFFAVTFRNTDFDSMKNTIVFLGVIILVGFIFTIFLRVYLKMNHTTVEQKTTQDHQ